KAHVGWGVMLDLSGVKVADDPAFSQLPFLQAKDVYVQVEFVPLLSRSIKVTSLVVSAPQVRIIRNHAGALNLSTIAKKPGQENKPPKPESEGGGGPSALAALMVKSFRIENGALSYED